MNHYFFSAELHYQNDGRRFSRPQEGVHKTTLAGEAAYLELRKKLWSEHANEGALTRIQFFAFNLI